MVLEEESAFEDEVVMRTYRIVPLVLLACLGMTQVASAQEVDDYSGKYDLKHTGIRIDLDIYVTPPKYSTVLIPINLDLTLENEQIPWSEVEFIVDEARAFMEAHGFPVQLEARIIMGLETVLEEVLAAVNEKMQDLPDQMVLVKTLPKGNMVTGTFSDLDGQGRQFALPGFLSPDTGELDLSSLFLAVLDAPSGLGSGYFTTGEFDVSQVFKGIKFEVEGVAEADTGLTRLE